MSAASPKNTLSPSVGREESHDAHPTAFVGTSLRLEPSGGGGGDTAPVECGATRVSGNTRAHARAGDSALLLSALDRRLGREAIERRVRGERYIGADDRVGREQRGSV